MLQTRNAHMSFVSPYLRESHHACGAGGESGIMSGCMLCGPY
jgi:hypothetical protein